MTNELIEICIGKKCQIYTGSFGISVTGKIVRLFDNWIEIKTKKGTELINIEFVQNIKIKS
ncbi:MAG: hypothetical protein JW702_04290 [Clostridiales bacterium]|nr:hypothetical protein [Clostridiales bacterium]